MSKAEGDNRRSFLKHLLAGTAAVVGTTAVVKPAGAAKVMEHSRPPEVLYRETEDFKNYYKSLKS